MRENASLVLSSSNDADTLKEVTYVILEKGQIMNKGIKSKRIGHIVRSIGHIVRSKLVATIKIKGSI